MEKNNIPQQKIAKAKDQKITRKEALKKAGYYAATAAGMMLLLGKPQKAMANSPAAPPAW